MKHLFIALAIASLVACAANSSTQTKNEKLLVSDGVADIVEEEGSVKASDKRVICEQYSKTGTHRIEKRCYTVAESNKEMEANQAELRRLDRKPRVRTNN